MLCSMRVTRLDFVLPLLISSLAAAQVRPVPVDAGRAPLAVPGGMTPLGAAPSSFLSAPISPSLAPSFTAAPSPAEILAAAQAPAPLAVAPTAAASPVRQPAASAPTAPSLAGEPRPSVKRAGAERDSTGGRATALDDARAAVLAPETPRLDALFDGEAPRSVLAAAADGPERPSAPKPLRRGIPRRVLKVAAVAVPLAVIGGVVGVLAPPAALLGLHWLGQAAYWLANPFAFLFTVPQIYRMLAHRSADVSSGMMAVGLAATATAVLNFAFDGKDLMMYRNLAQMFGFAAMLALRWRFTRAPGQPSPSRTRAILETGTAVLIIGGLMFAAGPALMAVVPGVALMNSLLVPLQIASGFGFTYLMYAQLSKMKRDHSSGDSSRAMMWAFLGTKTIWVWSLATMVSLATAPAWLTLPAAVGFAAVCWLAGKTALKRLLKAPWASLPDHVTFAGKTLRRERIVDIAAFVSLSALILALSAVGYFGFVDVLGVPHAAASRFAMYLLYMVQSLIACLATLKTLKLHKRYAADGVPH